MEFSKNGRKFLFTYGITFYNFSESKEILKNKIKNFKLSWPIKIKIEK
ncbi:hypothetical protein N506_0089 [Lactobacillus gasseri DSM 14869]|nr:hypothetical protein N506_0089 [Lactobacillus gasseri DSM 14869]